MDNFKKIVVGEDKPVESAEDLEAFIEAYKKQNPVKFALKEKEGKFDKLRAKFGGKVAKPVEKPIKGKK